MIVIFLLEYQLKKVFHEILLKIIVMDLMEPYQLSLYTVYQKHSIHAHGNNHGTVVNNIPDVIELTYINKNYFN